MIPVNVSRSLLIFSAISLFVIGSTLLYREYMQEWKKYQREFAKEEIPSALSKKIKVYQVEIPELKGVFGEERRRENCISCHLGINNPNIKGKKNPFRQHPRLDMFVESKSPHPLGKIGCTICHRGFPLGLTFDKAGHLGRQKITPELKQRQSPGYNASMLPSKYIWASCYQCHYEQTDIRLANTLNKGKHLVERLGCSACHNLKHISDGKLQQPGPSLDYISVKTHKNWVYSWLSNPRKVNPDSKMPRFFFPDKEKIEEKMIKILVEFIFTNSKDIKLSEPPNINMDVKEGEKLFNLKGCIACHNVGKMNFSNQNFGPALSKAGDKLNLKWLYNYIKEPSLFSKNKYPRMPKIKLEDSEIINIAGFLMSLRGKSGSVTMKPRLESADINEVSTLLEASCEVNKSKYEKLNCVAESIISRFGCFSCHHISYFSGSKVNIGPELDGENSIGDRKVSDLHFGKTNIERTLWAWLEQKIKEPRSFDTAGSKFTDRLRMPMFNLKEDEIQSIVTYLLGLTSEKLPQTIKRNLSQREEDIETGKRLLYKLNCLACHKFTFDYLVVKEDEEKTTGLTGNILFADEDNIYLLLTNHVNLGQSPYGLKDAKYNPGKVHRVKNDRILEVTDGLGGYITGIIPVLEAKYHTKTSEESFSYLIYSPPPLFFESERVQSQWLFKFLKQPYKIRPWLNLNMPDFHLTDSEVNILIKFFYQQPFETFPELTNKYMQGILAKDKNYFQEAEKLFKALNCSSCHKSSESARGKAPSLLRAGSRLKPQWIIKWLENPQFYQYGTDMPAYSNLVKRGMKSITKKTSWQTTENEIKALRDYVIIKLTKDQPNE